MSNRNFTRIITGPGGMTDMLDLNDPDWSSLPVDSIALALGNSCRFNGLIDDTIEPGTNPRNVGQPAPFYSVAQHAVMCASMMYRLGGETDTVALALMHDDVETVTGDITTPIKDAVPGLRAFCEELETSYLTHHGLANEWHNWVRSDVDRKMYLIEVSEFYPYEDDQDRDALRFANRYAEPLIPWPNWLAILMYRRAREIIAQARRGDPYVLPTLPLLVNAANGQTIHVTDPRKENS